MYETMQKVDIKLCCITFIFHLQYIFDYFIRTLRLLGMYFYELLSFYTLTSVYIIIFMEKQK